MGKRRRERDRPKAAHDAQYNPNKRVLLSYGSDEEEDELDQPVGTGRPDALDAVIDNYQIEEYPDDDEDEVELSTTIVEPSSLSSDQPVRESNSEGAYAQGPNAKRKPPSNRGPRRNESTGQFPALGSLSYQWENQAGDGEDGENEDNTQAEAMAYLRAVRSQRQALPTVLTKDHEGVEIEEASNGPADDTRGYFEDGAYVARPPLGPTLSEDMKITIDAQEAYTRAFKTRFELQRGLLHGSLPGPEEASGEGDQQVTFPPDSNKARAQLIRTLRHKSPSSNQVRGLDRSKILGLLQLMQKHHLLRERTVTRSTSTWIWSLLARLDDVGSMDNSTVSDLREFAKRAILVQLSFHDAQAAEQLESGRANDEVEEDGSNGVDGPDSGNAVDEVDTSDRVSEPLSGKDVAATVQQQSSTASNHKCLARENTLATLDMIIVIIGDLYGQRDLLEFRRAWSVPDSDEQTDEQVVV